MSLMRLITDPLTSASAPAEPYERVDTIIEGSAGVHALVIYGSVWKDVRRYHEGGP